ncbi:MAG: hypothetical protein HETSPECPRED_007550 [Heterodermia speciosa]|uniref:Uncharacterized protein n=1 Tax=Heterodermia speciosa TaxID=116794 RepID=A0A8H3FQ17_9LECA|nr:MAG: hypothetical protein HETSPECPRED_007550 [Heterodermia speciosa]
MRRVAGVSSIIAFPIILIALSTNKLLHIVQGLWDGINGPTHTTPEDASRNNDMDRDHSVLGDDSDRSWINLFQGALIGLPCRWLWPQLADKIIDTEEPSEEYLNNKATV